MVALPTMRKKLRPASFIVDTFDIMLHNSDSELRQLQARFSQFLRALDGPARFVTWHIPTSLDPLIEFTMREAETTANPWRVANLMDYRQWYEDMQRTNSYQQSLAGLAVWIDPETNPEAVGHTAKSSFGVPVTAAKWPPLLRGDYRIAATPFWHLEPVGRPSGRPLVCIMGTYSFKPVEWNFYRPLVSLYTIGFPIAVCVDIPKTYDSTDSVAKLEGVITALQTHLVTSRQLDTASQRQIQDAHEALRQIHAGDSLHDVQIKITVAAPDVKTLKVQVEEIRKRLKPFMGIRVEVGTGQRGAAEYFTATKQTDHLEAKPTVWPMLSDALALCLGFIGIRKLEPRAGIIRGANSYGGWPYIYDDWETTHGKKAVHELWVGLTGSGKTFALNCYLSRSLAHLDVPFDLLEPLGHGQMLARAFNIEPYILSAKHTSLNPHDPVYPTIPEQVAHSTAIYETFLQRPLSGDQVTNHQRAMLGIALQTLYEQFERHTGRAIATMRPHEAPLVEHVCQVLHTLGDTEDTRLIARKFAEEIAGLATGRGPFSYFLNRHTSMDISISHESEPRIFCFHEMEKDPILIAIAYTQVIAAIMRTAMNNEHPRVVAVDEVYRMMRHPSLLKFLIEAVKTLRTKRKKIIAIDQQMRVFLQGEARLLFENCPIRVIFSQKGGEDIFANDHAFQHYNDYHRELIGKLAPRQFMMETPEGIFFLNSIASAAEIRKYGNS